MFSDGPYRSSSAKQVDIKMGRQHVVDKVHAYEGKLKELEPEAVHADRTQVKDEQKLVKEIKEKL